MNQEPNHIDAAIADLENWLARISTAIETLKYFRSQGGALPGIPAPGEVARVSLNGDIPHDAFFQMTVADATEKYLGMTKKTKRIPELADALLKGGVKSSSKKFPDMVRIMIRRDPRFVNVNGEWGLREWYPGMRRGLRPAEQPTERKSTPAKGTPAKNSSPSIRERTLGLLKSKPSQVFTPAEVAERLEEAKPSVTTILCELAGKRQIARPEKGRYQALEEA